MYNLYDWVVVTGHNEKTDEVEQIRGIILEVGYYPSPANESFLVEGYRINFDNGDLRWLPKFLLEMVSEKIQ